jgi:uncharacterized membrane protein YesL
MGMSMSDLIRATVVCGGVAFLVYSFPVLSQVILIAFLSLLWLSCAAQAFQYALRKWLSRQAS